MIEQYAEKLNNIFEIKIKQDKLSDLLKFILNKIQRIEGQMRQTADQYQKKTIQIDPAFVKTIVRDQVALWQRINHEHFDKFDQQLLRLQQIHNSLQAMVKRQLKSRLFTQNLLSKGMESQIKDKITKIENKLQLIEKLVNTNDELLQGQGQSNSQLVLKIDQLNDLFEGSSQKIEHLECQFDKINTKLNEEKQRAIEQASILPMERKDKPLIKKSKFAVRKSVDNANTNLERSSIDSHSQSSAIMDAGLAKRVQLLEKTVANLQQCSQLPKAIEEQSASSSQNIEGVKNQDAPKIEPKPRRDYSKLYKPLRKSMMMRPQQLRRQTKQDSNFKEMCQTIRVNENADIKKLSERINQQQYKQQILQQNYEAMLKKMARVNALEAIIQSKVSEVQKLRIDTNTINEINMRFRQIQNSLLEQQPTKCLTIDAFHKKMQSFQDQINTITSDISKAAKEDEVKAAFNFLQIKMKEIVIVLSAKFQEEKIGAINRIQCIKCLSCDKQAEVYQNSNKKQDSTQILSFRNNRLNRQQSLKHVNSRKVLSKIKTDENQ